MSCWLKKKFVQIRLGFVIKPTVSLPLDLPDVWVSEESVTPPKTPGETEKEEDEEITDEVAAATVSGDLLQLG